MIFSRATPGSGLVPNDQVQLNGFVRNTDHAPIGVSLPPAPAPWVPQMWNKLADFPSSQSINHGKAPLQR